jgi:type VI secretion system secreted protein VgrG
MASADTSIFSLQLGGFPLDTFRVIDFVGRESLSECYTFTIRAVAFDIDLKFDEAIGVSAALFVGGAEFDIKHFGLITSFTQVPDSDGTVMLNSTYEFVLEPRIKIASYMSQSRIFQNKTVVEIVEAVLGDYFIKDTDFKIDCEYEAKGQSYAKREFTVQYNESDLDFVQRLLEEEGIFYFFNHEGDREVMTISNKKDAFKPLPNSPKLPFRPETGLHFETGEYVDSLIKNMKFVTGRTTLKDYNYRTPDTKVVGFFEMQGPGEYYHYGDHVKTTDEATRLAQLRTEMFACEREVYRGTGIARSMRPGYRFTLEHAGAEGFNGDYLITRVVHHGDITRANDDGTVEQTNKPIPHYTNSFEGIPALVQFRPQMVTPKPKAPGILTAKVDGQKGSYAYLDEEGRYRMKLFFDRSEDKDGKASKAIRLAQPYAGAGYGMHFPLHTDTEIAVGFVDGDLDRPIGLGAIPNPGKGTPVKAGNKSQNMIKSHSGHSITLDDKEGKTGIHISTSGGHSISMDDSAGSKGISMGTSGKYTFKLDDTGKAASMATNGGHSLTLTDEKTAINIVSTGKLHIDLDDAKKSITIADGGGTNQVIVDSAGNKVNVNANGMVVVTAKDSISLTSGSSSITLESNGTITIAGTKVNITGSDSVTIDGKTVSLTGSDKAAINSSKEAGLTVASSTVTCKPDGVSTSGAKVSASAVGIHEIGGALIKIG